MEKSRAVSSTFSPPWDTPDVMLTNTRWYSLMSKEDAILLCLLCNGVVNEDFVTFEVAKGDGAAYHVERRFGGRFTHWVAPMKFQVELQEWKRRLEDGETQAAQGGGVSAKG